MKRFWTAVETAAEDGGYGVRLDGKPRRTPGRRALIVPTEPVAERIADEWRAVAETIDPRALPLTGLANAAIDVVAPDPATFAAGLARYGESDLLLYRAEGPQSLIAAQAEAWDPLLAWAAERYDISFTPTTGILHRAQPETTIARLKTAVAARDPFRLAALSPLVTIGGSLITALAVDEGEITADSAWSAVTVDERWQESRWGDDPLAAAARDARRRDWDSAALFLRELG